METQLFSSTGTKLQSQSCFPFGAGGEGVIHTKLCGSTPDLCYLSWK